MFLSRLHPLAWMSMRLLQALRNSNRSCELHWKPRSCNEVADAAADEVRRRGQHVQWTNRPLSDRTRFTVQFDCSANLWDQTGSAAVVCPESRDWAGLYVESVTNNEAEHLALLLALIYATVKASDIITPVMTPELIE